MDILIVFGKNPNQLPVKTRLASKIGKKESIDFSNCTKLFNAANIYLFKFKNINTRERFEICSKFTVKIS